MPVEITGYSHAAICVGDVEAARAFYGGALGLQELPRPDLDFPGAWYQVGALQLHLMQREQVPGRTRSIGPHFALHVPEEAFRSTLDALRERVVRITREPLQRESDGIWAAFCANPDGNLIEITDMGLLV